jgi:hypothetical protein
MVVQIWTEPALYRPVTAIWWGFMLNTQFSGGALACDDRFAPRVRMT